MCVYVEGRYIIVLEISSGMQKPYCIEKLGPIEDTFIRISGKTRLPIKTIRELIANAVCHRS